MDYKASGVDIDAGNETVKRIRKLAKSTFTPGVLSDIGSFGGLFKLDTAAWKEPVLVSSADGVGTKLKVAFMTNRHRTIGVDLVNHCVNDILVQGATPLFFLDYLATGRLSPDVAEQIVEGLARGCQDNGCALLGGETAEMPGFYANGEYDLAGFIVGAVDRSKVIDGKNIAAGDVVLGLPSNGLQTNGYSLARKLFFEIGGYKVDTYIEEIGKTVGEALLEKHTSFLKPLDGLLDSGRIKGLAHITGGGFLENIPRILPENVSVEIKRGTWNELPVFGLIQKLGNVTDAEMFRTFNMGVGMVIICALEDIDYLKENLPASFEIGKVTEGKREVSII